MNPLAPRDPDAFGQEMLAYLKEGESMEIIEREDGYIDVTPDISHYFAAYPDWKLVEHQAIDQLVVGSAGGRTLDIGCGPGRVSLYLQSRGIPVVAIDNSPGTIEVCRARGVQDTRVCSITQAGPALGQFDNIVLFGNNWGLMGSFRLARWLLKRFQRITTPEARILATSNNIYATTNPTHLAYQAWNRTRGRMPGQIRFRVRFERACSPWFDYLMVSPAEMTEILSSTGWHIQHCFEDDGPQYSAVIAKG